ELIAENVELRAVVRRFGSIVHGARAAGIQDWPILKRTVALSRKEAISRLSLYARPGKTLSFTDLDKRDPRLVHALRKHFRTFGEALIRAGLAEHDWRCTRATILRAMRDRLLRGRPVHAARLLKEARGLHGAIRRVFGSHRDLYRKLGIRPLQETWTKER